MSSILSQDHQTKDTVNWVAFSKEKRNRVQYAFDTSENVYRSNLNIGAALIREGYLKIYKNATLSVQLRHNLCHNIQIECTQLTGDDTIAQLKSAIESAVFSNARERK